jgi:hypothetical protein
LNKNGNQQTFYHQNFGIGMLLTTKRRKWAYCTQSFFDAFPECFCICQQVWMEKSSCAKITLIFLYFSGSDWIYCSKLKLKMYNKQTRLYFYIFLYSWSEFVWKQWHQRIRHQPTCPRISLDECSCTVLLLNFLVKKGFGYICYAIWIISIANAA